MRHSFIKVKDKFFSYQDEAQLAYIAIVDGLAGQEEAELAENKANQGPGEQYEGMTITRENKIFHLRLNRPKKKNAITWQVGLANLL